MNFFGDSAILLFLPNHPFVLSRSTVITVLGVFALTILLIFLFLHHQASWTAQNRQLQEQLDSVMVIQENTEIRFNNYLKKARNLDSVQAKEVYDNYFDAYDEQNFRLYALYKDTERNYSSKNRFARAFNIENPASIKSNEVMGDTWYITPIKGVHFVKSEKDSWSQIAKKYYFNPRDSVLIRNFNKELKPNKFVVIPFN